MPGMIMQEAIMMELTIIQPKADTANNRVLRCIAFKLILPFTICILIHEGYFIIFLRKSYHPFRVVLCKSPTFLRVGHEIIFFILSRRPFSRVP